MLLGDLNARATLNKRENSVSAFDNSLGALVFSLSEVLLKNCCSPPLVPPLLPPSAWARARAKVAKASGSSLVREGRLRSILQLDVSCGVQRKNGIIFDA